jgi:hypothetical protein
MFFLIAAALAISLIIVAAPPQRAEAANGMVEAEWDRVLTPTVDGGTLAPNSTIIDYALAQDGEVAWVILYNETITYVDSDGPWYLCKSDDHAATWSDFTDELEDELDLGENDPANPNDDDHIVELVQVATDWQDPDFVAVAVWWADWDSDHFDYYLHVFVSNDGGTKFKDAGEVEDGAKFNDPDDVADLAVSYEADGEHDVAICGQDMAGTAALFRCTVDGDKAGKWYDVTDTDYPGWDNSDEDGLNWDFVSLWVTDLIYSPNWIEDRTILAVTITPSLVGPFPMAVYLQSGAMGDDEGGWNEQADFSEAVVVEESVDIPFWLAEYDARVLAGVTLPLDYLGSDPGKRYVWVWVNYIDHDGPATPMSQISKVIDDFAQPVADDYGQVPGRPWLTNVAYLGDIEGGKALAGVLGTGDMVEGFFTPCCEGVQVYRNDGVALMDMCCKGWTDACKPPTGRGAMAVSWASDNHPTETKAYAVALHGWENYNPDPADPYKAPMAHDESAWSMTFDDGETWNQLSLIDTHIDYFTDVAVSPDCGKTMAVSVNLHERGIDPPWFEPCGCDSVWLRADPLPEGAEYSGKWLRTWCGMLTNNHGLLRLAPEELLVTEVFTVYLVDKGTTTLYWNSLETLGCWKKRTASNTITSIQDLAVKESGTIFALDESGKVTMSDDHGAILTWTDAVSSEVSPGWTIALHGDHILVGGADGVVSYAMYQLGDEWEDLIFTKLEDENEKSVALTGKVTVAFDSYFPENDTIYAAVAEGGDENGIYRWVIGQDEDEGWLDLRAVPDWTLPEYMHFTGLVLDRPAPGNPMTSPETGGVLYASYALTDGQDILTGRTGVARYLTPAEEVICAECEEWDYLEYGLSMQESFTAMPHALKICGCLEATSNSRLFAIDWLVPAGYDMLKGKDGSIWMFEDCYAKKAVDPRYPDDGQTMPSDPCCPCGNVEFPVRWNRLCDSCEYELQFALDEDFTEVMLIDFECHLEEPADPRCVVPAHLLTCGVTYYWRVRATAGEHQTIRSWWSDPQSVTIAPASVGGVNLVAPANGADNVATTGILFSWTEVTGADRYDWLLYADSPASPIAEQPGLTTTSHKFNGAALDNETQYGWRVTAYKDGSVFSVSDSFTFTTVAEPIYCCQTCGLCFDTQQELQDHIEAMHGPITPTWVWVVIGLGAALVIVVIILIFRTRRV